MIWKMGWRYRRVMLLILHPGQISMIQCSTMQTLKSLERQCFLARNMAWPVVALVVKWARNNGFRLRKWWDYSPIAVLVADIIPKGKGKKRSDQLLHFIVSLAWEVRSQFVDNWTELGAFNRFRVRLMRPKVNVMLCGLHLLFNVLCPLM